MSIFISYNYETGLEHARIVVRRLERLGVDVWWLEEKVEASQLDTVVGAVLGDCERCIVLWSTFNLSQWQRSEIQAIQERLLARRPPLDPTDFFLILRNDDDSSIRKAARLPLLGRSEYVPYFPKKRKYPRLAYLNKHIPGLLPLTTEDQRRPCFDPNQDIAEGKYIITGRFRRDTRERTRRYCWIVLEDDHDRWYLQLPRPTVTHRNRWIAPNIVVGDGIKAVVLIALSADAYRKSVQRVLNRSFGGIPKDNFGSTTELARIWVGGERPAIVLSGRERGLTGRVNPDDVLRELACKAFRWFLDNRNPITGMVRDRGGNRLARGSRTPVSSIASTGYYLSLLPSAARFGWIERRHAETEALRTLRFASEGLASHHGLLHHFLDWESGEPAYEPEFSLLDTAIFLNGCMVVAEGFAATSRLANRLIDRVDWRHFLVLKPGTKKKLLSLGWRPGHGRSLLGPADVRSSEFAMAYFLAIGARAHPVHPSTWYNTRVLRREVCGYRVLNPDHPLFTSYYGLGWADLRGMADCEGVDLNANAREAALANREYCRRLAAHCRTYSAGEGHWWGLSAGDSPAGYVARGPRADHLENPDGTVWPTAALAAVPWVADELLQDLTNWTASRAWHYACGDYGLAPFSLDPPWVGEDVIGIDLGSYAVSYLNYRDGAIWKLWMSHPVARAAMKRIGYAPRDPT